MVSSYSVRALGRFTEEEVEEENEDEDLADSVYVCFSYYKTYREIEYNSRNMMVYFKRLRSSGFVEFRGL